MATFWLGAVSTTNGSAFVTVDNGDDINLIQERSLLQIETEQFVEVKRAFTDAGNVPTIELSQAWGGSAGSNRPAIAAPTAGNLAEAAERLRTLGDSATAILDNALLRDDNLAGLANAGTARNNLGLTAAATTEIMASLTDTTADRLMPQGAHGLGRGNLATGNIDIDALYEATQFLRVDSGATTTTGNVSLSGGDFLQVLRWDDNTAYQRLTKRNPTRVFERYRGGGSWSPFTRAFFQNNILGTVSQSGGVPTGAIIERGSNANGEYVKFADGRLECTREIVLEQSSGGELIKTGVDLSANMVNSNYRLSLLPNNLSADAGFSFSDVNAVGAGGKGNGSIGQVRCTVLNGAASTGDTISLDMIAVGRWF